MGFPWWLSSKESACSAGDAGGTGSIPGLGRFPGEGNGYPLQYSCLDNPMDRGARWATVHGIAESQTCFSDQIHMHHIIICLQIDIHVDNFSVCVYKHTYTHIYICTNIIYFKIKNMYL